MAAALPEDARGTTSRAALERARKLGRPTGELETTGRPDTFRALELTQGAFACWLVGAPSFEAGGMSKAPALELVEADLDHDAGRDWDPVGFLASRPAGPSGARNPCTAWSPPKL